MSTIGGMHSLRRRTGAVTQGVAAAADDGYHNAAALPGSILAIDSGTRTGICDGPPGETPRLSILRLRRSTDETPADLFERAAAWMWRRIACNPPPIIVVVEAPVPPFSAKGVTNHQTTVITMGLYGIFVGIARARGIPTQDAPISTWRKFALGRGNLRGPDAKAASMELCRRLGWPAPDHNAAEAAGIWLWAGRDVRTIGLFARRC